MNKNELIKIYRVYIEYCKEKDLYNTMVNEDLGYNNKEELNNAYNAFSMSLKNAGISYKEWMNILREEEHNV